MGDEVSVDPVDDAGIDISHLEQRWNRSSPVDPHGEVACLVESLEQL